MNRVVLEQVAKVVEVHEGIVDGHDLGLVGVLCEGRAEGESSNSSEAVDSESDAGHSSSSVVSLFLVDCLILINSSGAVDAIYGSDLIKAS